MKKKKFCTHDQPSEDVSLQITSMADIFTIILVFLLKSSSTGLADVVPTQGVVLPEAAAQAHMKDALKIEILKDSVLVDQHPTVGLKDFMFADTPGQSEKIVQALTRVQHRHSSATGTPESHVLLFADERVPYATLKRVMNSAAVAGYVDLELAVVQAP